MSVDFILETVDLAESTLDPILGRLLDGDDSDIVIEQYESEILLNYLDELSQVSEDATFQDVIYTIKLDINQYSGQTRQEIVLDLN